jgi:hypothetical protein
MFKSRLSGIAIGILILISASSAAHSNDLPVDDPGLFSYLFTQKSIPADWISEPASEELTPAMMNEIAEKLSSEGGKYQEATKTAGGWILVFQHGSARARIVRAANHKIVGVFFSGLE